jgi:ABC-2 type transport system ATP-binding protein
MIEVDGLSKIYGTKSAIKDISFTVQTGEILGFLGPNGAGKTTTMRILAGYLPASTGTAKIAGYDVHADSIRVGEVVERCNLGEYRRSPIRKLSKGMKQRVGIAQAIVHDPPVIILDEPTVGLDPKQIIDMRHLIKSLAGDHTVILSTHILPEVSMTCDRVTIINRGKVVTTNTPDILMAELAGGNGYEIEIDGNPAEIQKMLQIMPGICLVEVVSSYGLPGDRSLLRMVCSPGAEPGRDIAAVVVGASRGLYEMRRTRASLEDVFLELTTKELSL